MKLITKSLDKVANKTPLSPMYKASAETWPSSKGKMYAECYILMEYSAYICIAIDEHVFFVLVLQYDIRVKI